MANQYTKTKINRKAVEEYVNGNGSLTILSKKYNVTRKIFTRWIKEEKQSIRLINNRIKKYNEFIFDKIDTEEKAYWLGFIAADGYISDQNHFELSLGLKDKNHLEKFGKFINKNVTVDHFRCRIGINNKHLRNTLFSYGIVPRKSLILEFFTQLKPNLISHYIRGYFDGDGCVYLGNNNKNIDTLTVSCSIRFLGTKNFLLQIQEILNVKSSLTQTKGQNIFVLNIRSVNSILKTQKFLYNDSSIFLERKQEKYCRLEQKCLRILASKYGERCDS